MLFGFSACTLVGSQEAVVSLLDEALTQVEPASQKHTVHLFAEVLSDPQDRGLFCLRLLPNSMMDPVSREGLISLLAEAFSDQHHEAFVMGRNDFSSA